MSHLKFRAACTAAFGLRALTASAALIVFAGCTTFQGPGELQTERPSIILQGARIDSRVDQAPYFDWPVDEARLSRGFMSTNLKRKRAHWGLDLAAPRGTPILAAQSGTVVYTGNAFRGYGRLVVVEHDGQWATLYAHLDKIHVKEGQVVARGERLGLMGRSGRATGVHLHFEIRSHRQPVNPLAYLPLDGGLASGALAATLKREYTRQAANRVPQGLQQSQ